MGIQLPVPADSTNRKDFESDTPDHSETLVLFVVVELHLKVFLEVQLL